MATFHNYRCEQCGYTISTAPSGKYALFSGEHRTYLCKHCRDIVSVNETMARDPEMLPECPDCGYTGLLPWNPVTCGCPKCGGKMVQDGDESILID